MGKPKKVKKGLSEGELKDLYAFVSSLGDIGLKDPLSFILSIGDQKTEKDDGKDRKDVHSNKTSFTFEAAEALVAPVTKMFYGEPSTEGAKKPESKAKSSSPAPVKKSNSVTTKTIPVTTTTKEALNDRGKGDYSSLSLQFQSYTELCPMQVKQGSALSLSHFPPFPEFQNY